jgi:UDP-glucose 4-epimerase
MTQNVIVTGGAGYIGSHTCAALSRKGFNPVTVDNLSNGHAEFVKWGPFINADIRDGAMLNSVFDEYKPVGIIHFAALIEVGQSVKEPLAFYENNLLGSLSLLQAAARAKAGNLVFSSTCATYGLPKEDYLSEQHSQEPINPYGRTKMIVEHAIRDIGGQIGLNNVIMRYFNASGASNDDELGEWHDPETHVIPLLLDAAHKGKSFNVLGTDYPTPDGTCVRDYIHVSDLAEAHVIALEKLIAGMPSDVFNLGTGTGTSVLELLRCVADHTGQKIDVNFGDRRAGDSHQLVAANGRAKERLGWTPSRGLGDIVSSADVWYHALEKIRAEEASAL